MPRLLHLLLLTLAIAGLPASSPAATEEANKKALVSIGRFLGLCADSAFWPPQNDPQQKRETRIGLLSRSTPELEYSEGISDYFGKARPFKVQKSRDADDLTDCHVILIFDLRADDLQRAFRTLQPLPIMVIGSSPNDERGAFLKLGGMVEYAFVKDASGADRFQFGVNVDQAAATDIRLKASFSERSAWCLQQEILSANKPVTSEKILSLFLLNTFASAQWPASRAPASQDSIRFGILDPTAPARAQADPLGECLEYFLTARKSGSPGSNPTNKTSVSMGRNPQALTNCHLVLLRNQTSAQEMEALRAFRNQPMITVRESRSFLQRGGIVEFALTNLSLAYGVNVARAKPEPASNSNFALHEDFLKAAGWFHPTRESVLSDFLLTCLQNAKWPDPVPPLSQGKAAIGVLLPSTNTPSALHLLGVLRNNINRIKATVVGETGTIELIPATEPSTLAHCHLVLLHSLPADRALEALTALRTSPVFTVSDTPESHSHGAIIEILPHPDLMLAGPGDIPFVVNLDAAGNVRIEPNSSFLGRARRVISTRSSQAAPNSKPGP